MWVKIPGLAEAIKRENDIRDAAFLDEVLADICGVKIRQMTPRDLLILDGIGNPVIQGEIPSPAELADFLWRLSPDFKSHAPMKLFLFARHVRKLSYHDALEACRKYVTDTFQDSPASSEQQGAAPYAAWCAHLVCGIASTFGWSESAILNTPLKRLFQYLKCIRRQNNPQAIMHNPSDKCKGDYLRLLNARSQLVNLLARRTRN